MWFDDCKPLKSYPWKHLLLKLSSIGGVHVKHCSMIVQACTDNLWRQRSFVTLIMFCMYPSLNLQQKFHLNPRQQHKKAGSAHKLSIMAN